METFHGDFIGLRFDVGYKLLLDTNKHKTNLVNSVRVILRLQAEGTKLMVKNTSLARESIKSIGSVKLNSRLIGEHFKNTPTAWMIHSARSLPWT